MAGRKLIVQIVGDAKNLEQSLHSTESKMGRFGKTAGAAGLALGGVLAVGIEKSVHAALGAQVSQARLEQAFKRAHLTAGAYKDQIEELEGRSRKLGFTDDDVRSSLGSLITATGSAHKAMKELSVAQDLARFKGISLKDATKALTMAQTGSQRAIKQLGLTVQKSTEAEDKAKLAYKAKVDALKAQFGPLAKLSQAERDRYDQMKNTIDLNYQSDKAMAKSIDTHATAAKIIETVSHKLKGQSDEYAKTAGGGMAQFSAQLDHLEETLGKVLIPVLTTVAQHLASLGEFLSKHTTLAKALAIGLGVLATALIAASVATTLLNLAFLASPIGLVVIAIAGLVAGLIVAYQKSETFRTIVQGAFKGVKDAVDALIDSFQWVQANWDKIWSIAKWTPPIVAIRILFEELKGAVALVRAAFEWIQDNFQSIWAIAKWTPLIAPIRILFENLGTVIGTIRTVFNWLDDNVAQIWQGIGKAVTKSGAYDAFHEIAKVIGTILAYLYKIPNLVKSALGWLGKIPHPSLPGLPSLPSIPGFASGVSNFAGGLAVVGERGPELVSLPGGSSVIPNSASGGSVNNFYFPNYTGPQDELMRAVNRGVRDLERGGGRLGGTRVQPGFAT